MMMMMVDEPRELIYFGFKYNYIKNASKFNLKVKRILYIFQFSKSTN